MCFLKWMPSMLSTKKDTNENILTQADAKWSQINKRRKGQATLFGHVMRREKIEHLVTTRKTDGKGDGNREGKQLDKTIIDLEV